MTSKYESDLLRALADFPGLLRNAVRELSPHLVCIYLSHLAAKLHSYYSAEKFLDDDENRRSNFPDTMLNASSTTKESRCSNIFWFRRMAANYH